MKIELIKEKKLQTISTMIKSRNKSVKEHGYGLLNKLINAECRKNKNSSVEEFYNIFRRSN